MEITQLSENELFEKLELFQDRVETLKIQDTDDAETRSNTETQLYRYRIAFSDIKAAIEMRKTETKTKSKSVFTLKLFTYLIIATNFKNANIH